MMISENFVINVILLSILLSNVVLLKMWNEIEVYLRIQLKAINILLGYDLKACNHRLAYVMICVGILCVSKFKYGKYTDINILFKRECEIRNIYLNI